MKILFIGQLGAGQTSQMRMEVLGRLGHAIIPLDSSSGWRKAGWLSRQTQRKANYGPAISALNNAVKESCARHTPDLVWAEKQEFLQPELLCSLKKRGIKLFHFTPDPYFTLSWKRTRLMDACLPIYDYVATCKRYELQEYQRICQEVFYMPLGFEEGVHRPVAPRLLEERQKFQSDVCFVGGWEARREALLNDLVRTGCDLKIWGFAWDHLVDGRWTARRYLRLRRLGAKSGYRITKNSRLGKAIQGSEIYGDEYAWALSGARIGVGFLRDICPDQHTTRSFEIPACGSMMIADRTAEHREFFEEGKEAEFFSSPDELIDKVGFYLDHESAREKIAAAGLARCLNSDYSYTHRVREVLTSMDRRTRL